MFNFTPKQGQYLAYIYHYTKLNRRPPAEADIQRFFGVTPPTVHQMILKLAEKGLIKRTPGQARSIELLVPVEQLPVLEGAGSAKTERQRADVPQLQMVWPERLLKMPPMVHLPGGYTLRTYQPGDEPRFYDLMALAGWPGWTDEKLKPWLSRVLPDGWFMVMHEARDEIVATAMGLHNYKEIHPFQSELGWVACDPAHQGQGLGLAVCAAVTARLIKAGYRNICLYSEDFRLAALKTYLKLGYLPLLYKPDMLRRWRTICEQLQWPYMPEVWRSQIGSLWE
jgi:mycothiol synthase